MGQYTLKAAFPASTSLLDSFATTKKAIWGLQCQDEGKDPKFVKAGLPDEATLSFTYEIDQILRVCFPWNFEGIQTVFKRVQRAKAPTKMSLSREMLIPFTTVQVLDANSEAAGVWLQDSFLPHVFPWALLWLLRGTVNIEPLNANVDGKRFEVQAGMVAIYNPRTHRPAVSPGEDPFAGFTSKHF